MGLDNYYFYLQINGGAYCDAVVFKITSAAETDDGIITLCLLNNQNEKIDSSIPRRLANRFSFFRDNSVDELIGKNMLINYDFVCYNPDQGDDYYFGIEDDRNLAIEVFTIEEAS